MGALGSRDRHVPAPTLIKYIGTLVIYAICLEDVGQSTRTRRLSTNMIEAEMVQSLVREEYGNMSDRDEKLFRFAKRKISEEFEPLNNMLIMIDFPDAGMLIILSRDADTQSSTLRRLHIGYDEKDNFIYIWKPATLGRTLINRTGEFFEAALQMLYHSNIVARFSNIVDSFQTIRSNIADRYNSIFGQN